MQKLCENPDCKRILTITSHYCPICLNDKLIIKRNHFLKNKVKGTLKEEITKLRNDESELLENSIDNLINEYNSILKEKPILFSEISITRNKFKQIIAELKIKDYEVHCYKFKLKNGKSYDGIVYRTEHKKEAAIKLMNIYPYLKLPKFLI